MEVSSQKQKLVVFGHILYVKWSVKWAALNRGGVGRSWAGLGGLSLSAWRPDAITLDSYPDSPTEFKKGVVYIVFLKTSRTSILW